MNDIETDFSKDNYLYFLLHLVKIPEDYSIPEDYKESVIYCIKNFTSDAGGNLIKLRYFNVHGMESTEDMSKKYKVTPQRIRQILERTKRRMRHNEQCTFILLNGLKKYNATMELEELKRKEILSNSKIEMLKSVSIEEIIPFDGSENSLRTRTYNSCKRANIQTFYDLVTFEHCRIRNIGKASEEYLSKQANQYLLNNFNIRLKDCYDAISKAIPEYTLINRLVTYIKED